MTASAPLPPFLEPYSTLQVPLACMKAPITAALLQRGVAPQHAETLARITTHDRASYIQIRPILNAARKILVTRDGYLCFESGPPFGIGSTCNAFRRMEIKCLHREGKSHPLKIKQRVWLALKPGMSLRDIQRAQRMHSMLEGVPGVLPLKPIVEQATPYPEAARGLLMRHAGKTLYDILQQANWRLPQTLCMKIARELATTLAEIHARGVVHSDIKPENILIDRKERQWLIDFNLSIAPEHTDPQLCQSPVLRHAGTPSTGAFTAPEFFNPAHYRPRNTIGDPFVLSTPLDFLSNDVWAFGCALYLIYYGKLSAWMELSDNTSKLAPAVTSKEFQTPYEELVAQVQKVLTKHATASNQDPLERFLFQRVLVLDPAQRCTMTEARDFLTALTMVG